MTMHDHATSCIVHERLRVEYGLVRKSCMNHARTCKIFFLGSMHCATPFNKSVHTLLSAHARDNRVIGVDSTGGERCFV